MSVTSQPNPEFPPEGRPPAQPMPPTPDLNVAVPATDSLGLPTPPDEPNEPIRGDDSRSSAVGWFTAALVTAIVIAGIALVIGLGR